MKKMQKIWLNIFLMLIGYVFPIGLLKVSAGNYEYTYKIQLIVLLIILVAGICITYLNNQNRKKVVEMKAWFIFFEILGILGILYSIITLYLIFAFRNGVNF